MCFPCSSTLYLNTEISIIELTEMHYVYVSVIELKISAFKIDKWCLTTVGVSVFIHVEYIDYVIMYIEICSYIN